MSEFGHFTEKGSLSLNNATKIASALGHIYIGSEHILCGLLSVDKCIAAQILTGQGVTKAEVLAKIEQLIGSGIPTKLSVRDFTPRSKRILDKAVKDAKMNGQSIAGTEHILKAMLGDSDCYGVFLLRELGVNLGALLGSCSGTREQIADSLDTSSTLYGYTPQKNKGSLRKYGKDLTALAHEDKLDPVICRDEEIDSVVQVLLRRRKNNPCLVGESGVGKTAIAEGLALRISAGQVPPELQNKQIFMLDLSSMLAGAKYRGDFEERIKNALDEIIKNGNIILFIDEIHTIIGAGAADGAIDAANILKPLLARGELRVLGATTIDEYRRYIEKDAALERRFQPITIEEPSENSTLEILHGLRHKYESHHKVKITDSALKSAVTLSSRYVSDRFLPDKAIDLIDEAASKLRIDVYGKGLRYDDENNDVEIQQMDAINAGDFEKAALLAKAAQEITDTQDSEDDYCGTITDEEIAQIVSKWTGIPVCKITETESEKLSHMQSILEKRVLGQSTAVGAVSRAIMRGRAGFKNPSRPIGSFLFLGPTGVGKTELCKALAQQLFGDSNSLLRFDMSEFMEKHSVSKLIGAPPGYIGFDDGGTLTEKIRRKPYSLILFDEVEKAHPDVLNLLLQVLEDGILTSSDGRTSSFKNAVIIMTSNIGARKITDGVRTLGFSSASDTVRVDDGVMNELKQAMKPEFVNRIDEIIIFNKLTRGDTLEICRKMLGELAERSRPMDITLSFSDDAVEKLAELGYDEKYGARPLRRIITANVEDLLSQMLLDGRLKQGDEAMVDYHDGDFLLKRNKEFVNNVK